LSVSRASHADAVTSEEVDRVAQKSDGGVGFLIGQDLGEGQARVIVDGNVQSLPARMLVPAPVYNPSWTGIKVIHWGQDWHVGTCVNGSGPRVQSDTIQKWTDHALHTNITSPAP
jgi:hypothetical protein